MMSVIVIFMSITMPVSLSVSASIVVSWSELASMAASLSVP